MSKKNLKDKINLTIQWSIGLTILYLIVGSLLISDHPLPETKIDLDKAYNLVKDALTLLASFLAPVAAFVLFSDWRNEHKALQNESEAKIIFKSTKNIDEKIFIYTRELVNLTNQENQVLMQSKLEESERLEKENLEMIKQIEFAKINFSNLDFLLSARNMCSENYGVLFYSQHYLKCTIEYNIEQTEINFGLRLNAYEEFKNARNNYELTRLPNNEQLKTEVSKYIIE